MVGRLFRFLFEALLRAARSARTVRGQKTWEMMIIKCPVCGQHEFAEMGSFDICPVCGWEDDNLQDNDDNYAGGANALSVNEARIEFFLLRMNATKEEATLLKEAYSLAREMIYSKYGRMNRIQEPEKAQQETLEFRLARKKYIDELNSLLQSVT